MVDRGGARNWGARLLAPVVFFAAVTLLVLIVQSSLDDGGGSSSPPAAVTVATGGSAGTETAAAETSESEPATTEASGPKQTYRVRSGDTLESIAARFDTTVADLLELNPNIDPLALRPNQKIRIR